MQIAGIDLSRIDGVTGMQRQIRAGLFLVFCWGLGGAVAGAQQPFPATPPTGAVPTPIPLSEIALQTESTVASVQSVETTLSADQVTENVEKRLPLLTREIDLRGTEMAKYLAGNVPLEFLHSMGNVLHAYRAQLSGWNHDLTERAKTLEAQLNQLEGFARILAVDA